MPEILIILLKILVPFLVIFQLLPLLIWLERKGSAFIQDRHGPNRAAIQGVRLGGVVHSIADVFKLLFKEDIIPSHVNRFYYVLAPMIALFIACVTFLVIPFAAPIPTANGIFTFQAADLNIGILYILAMTSLGVYGVMMAGWASNNKFALLGGLRSSSQMVSYELSMGLAVMSVLMLTGSLALGDIAAEQTSNVFYWNCFRAPMACLIFIVSAFAETNRAPFDLPEGESELVAGYHVEYSSMKFAMFMMSEYVNMIIASALIVTLFFGGWQVPFVSTEILRSEAASILWYGLIVFAVASILIGGALCGTFRRNHYGDKRDYEVLVFGIPAILVGLGVLAFVFLGGSFLMAASTRAAWAAVFQILVFLAKILFMCWVFVWVRWTLPRFRYDQLMTLGWKYLLPLALGQVIFVALWLLR